jgi:hypothetical protein
MRTWSITRIQWNKVFFMRPSIARRRERIAEPA